MSDKSDTGSSQDYDVTGRGTNYLGNHWESRDFGEGAANDNTYAYRNQDGSSYASNGDGSREFITEKGIELRSEPGSDNWELASKDK